MKSTIIIALCLLFTTCGYCNYTTQTVVSVYCKDGPTQVVKVLTKHLNEGWRVINSTPILQSDTKSMSYNNWFSVTFTAYIIYILEKEILESPYAKHHREKIEINKEDSKYIKVEK